MSYYSANKSEDTAGQHKLDRRLCFCILPSENMQLVHLIYRRGQDLGDGWKMTGRRL